MKKTILFLSLIGLPCFSGDYSVSTWVGNGTSGNVDGKLTAARLNQPCGMCRDKNGNFYIADCGNNKIRKVDPEGNVTSLGASGQFNQPFNVCVDDSGNLYIADFANNRIRKMTSSGTVTTLAGSGTAGYKDGAAASAQFNCPRGVAVDKSGNVYVGDSWNHRIRKIDQAAGQVSTYAGGGSSIGVQSVGSFVDGKDTTARFYTPAGLSIDSAGNVYVADAYNHRIRKISTSRDVTSVAGSGSSGQSSGGFLDGNISSARFNTPTEVYVTPSGILLIGDTFNNRVRMVKNGAVSTIAGTGTAGYKDGADSVAQFNYTRGIVSNGNTDSIFVDDYNNHSLRLITRKNITGSTCAPATHPLGSMIFLSTATDLLAIEFFPQGKMSAFNLFDMSGRMILRKTNITDTRVTMPVANLVCGTYLITITIDGRESSKKFIIDR